eukprot:scaffold111453_cov30-Tisochrysis_lutea.AAC.1
MARSQSKLTTLAKSWLGRIDGKLETCGVKAQCSSRSTLATTTIIDYRRPMVNLTCEERSHVLPVVVELCNGGVVDQPTVTKRKRCREALWAYIERERPDLRVA